MTYDLYPSRTGSRPFVTKRQDPVIHTENPYEQSSPLSKEQLESYEKNGFLLLDSFFSEDETRSMRNEIEEMRREYSVSDRKEVIRELGTDEVRSIFAPHELNRYFKDLADDQRLQDITQFLLGSDVYIHQSRINYKEGFTGKEFYWHSDFETWHVEDGMPRMRAVSVSVLLTDNHVYNGPVMMIPGSHMHFVSCVGETPENHYEKSLQKQELGVPDNDNLRWLADQGGISVPTGKAGSILLFECNTMHGSNSNITPYGRNNIFLVYNSVKNRLVEPFSGGKPRPEYIAARQGIPVGQ
ncbi:ectoine hydroxylase [Siminovitchia sediminis]|uniref:Ectoine hydroxylase n=1 Tax=Siminovitchia sediminis TaxID=1274353 RepID=A0ABW4KLT0_9BACI